MRARFSRVSLIVVLSLAAGNPHSAFASSIPQLSSMSPSSAIAGSAAFTLTLTGTGFLPGSVVQWNGSNRTTTFVSRTQLTAAIPATDIASAGMVLISVLNPTMGSSQPLTFTIYNPSPRLTALSPSSVLVGGTSFTLSVVGSGFVSTSAVHWNSSNLPTTFVSSTQLTAAISASDYIANAGTPQITVFNPTPGGGTSNALSFTINNPSPSLTGLSPSSVFPGATNFTLSLVGSGFVSNSVVLWNSSSRPTTFVSSTQLTAAISASDIANVGTAQITVFNPAPGGGTSNPLAFAINKPPFLLVSASPANTPAGGPAFTLTATGSSFTSSSVVRWNDGDRTTTFVSSTQLRATILAGDIVSAGTTQVTVFDPSAGTSNALSFVITQHRVGVLERVSVASDGTQANGGSRGAVVSADGRLVAFTSEASNLVPNDTNGFPDVFLRDTCRGPSAPVGCAPSTVRVSVANDGSQTTFDAPYIGTFDYNYYSDQGLVVVNVCSNPTAGVGAYNANVIFVCLRLGSSVGSISANGRFVVFTSDASNLANNGSLNVFVRDTCIGAPAGCTPSTFPVSVASNGTEGNSDSIGGFVSADGRFVAFTSWATNLIANDTNYFQDVFVRDTCFGASAGCTPATFRVSLANDGTQGNGGSSGGAVSADGRFVSFSSSASNLVPNDTNGVTDAFVRDTCFGVVAGCTPSTFRTSVASDGTQGNGYSYGGLFSADGRFVAFDSSASNLVPNDTNGVWDVFVRDTCAGAPAGCTPSTSRVSVASDGTQGNGGSYGGLVSADGRFVGFSSDASNLVGNDTNGVSDVFVRNTCEGAPAGCMPWTLRVSVAGDGTQANQASSGSAITADGRFVVFVSLANNLVAGDTNGYADIFLASTGR